MLSETALLHSILAQLPPPQTVLELGCGNHPDALIYYAADSATLIGLDIDVAALRTVHIPAITLVQADIAHLPFHTRFDLIVVRHPDVIRHASAWRSVFNDIGAYLKPNGVLLITTYSLSEIEWIDSWMRPLTLVSFALEKLAPPGLQGCDRFIRVWRNL